MKVYNLSDKPSLLNQYLKEIRSVDVQNDTMRFRRNIERIGEIMAYEISKRLLYTTDKVKTPLGTAEIEVIKNQVVLGTILRAGLPFHQGFLNYFDSAENAFISAYRQYGRSKDGKQQMDIVSEYLAAPEMTDKTLLLVDPMLATGMSMEVAFQALCGRGKPRHIHLACVIGTNQAVKYLRKTMPENVTLWCAAIDPILNDHKYIVPGLGDAGDLCYGKKI